MMPVVLYILACVGVGIFGRDRRGGFLAFTLISALTHPILGAILLFLSAPVDEKQRLRKRGLRHELKEGERRPLLPKSPPADPDAEAASSSQSAPKLGWWARLKQRVSPSKVAEGAP